MNARTRVVGGPMGRLGSIVGALVVGLLGVGSLTGCGDNGPDLRGFPVLEGYDDGIAISNGIVAASAFGLEVGQTGQVSFIRLINVGQAPLEITNISIVDDSLGSFAIAADDAGAPLTGFPYTVDTQDSIGSRRSVEFALLYTRPPSGQVPTGRIRIESNTRTTSGRSTPVVDYEIRLDAARPIIQVVPSAVNFDTVALGSASTVSINVLNQGNDVLEIDSFIFRGHPDLEFIVGANIYKVTPDSASAGVVFDTPLVVGGGEAMSMSVRYTAKDDNEARGELILFSNDPSAPNGTVVPIQANVGGPCITVNPTKVAFGGKLVGREARVDVEIASCGDMPLELSEIRLLPTSSAEFRLSLANMPNAPANPDQLGPADIPIVLQPNQRATFSVIYFPEDISPFDGTGQPILDTGTVHIRSNAFRSTIETEIEAFGVEKECPTAVIIVQEGEEVIPQTELHLIGSQSYSTGASIVEYQWEVDQPNGSRSVFRPRSQQADVRFEVNVAGVYTFRLTVRDSAGETSCVPAVSTVYVNPNEAIHIELLWDTPNDPDQTNTGANAGADLDLHFTHPFAASGFDGDGDGVMDPWFDMNFDCFWYNAHPNWGNPDPSIDDNPSLDRDDTDGAGPENVNLNIPEDGIRYRVGVHYWHDSGYGPSLATVRTYIYGVPVFEVSGVELLPRDFWTVTEVAWPPVNGQPPELIKACSGTTQACTSDAECGAGRCGNRIAPNYNHPAFLLPQ